ncbi:MAG: hypothetical protein HC888_06470 [Candidatus Competibacteraceae bacterium]|nr:hypothetical protein [Candidatus Competibacteraceae bacterium]
MTIRDVSNKIIHAGSLQWNTEEEMRPLLICVAKEQEKWISAEIDILKLAAFCGRLFV